MAGTIVADTIQTGGGASTSMANAVNGSAKAWLMYQPTTQTITSSYNISSVTYSSGTYTLNFTTAMTNANYSVIATNGYNSSGGGGYGYILAPYGAPSTTSVIVKDLSSGGAAQDMYYLNVAIFGN